MRTGIIISTLGVVGLLSLTGCAAHEAAWDWLGWQLHPKTMARYEQSVKEQEAARKRGVSVAPSTFSLERQP